MELTTRGTAALPVRRHRAGDSRGKAAGVDVIDLGIGDPDLPTPPHIVEALAPAPPIRPPISTPATVGFREAVAAFYAAVRRRARSRRRDLPLLGAKEGIAHICWAARPRRRRAGARSRLPGVRHRPGLPMARPALPLLPERASCPTWRPSRRARARAKMIFVSYPNNPTGAVVEDDFFDRWSTSRSHDSSWSTTTPTPKSPTTGTWRRASWRLPAHGGRRRDLQPLQDLQHDRLARGRHGRQPRGHRGDWSSRPTWTRACSGPSSGPPWRRSTAEDASARWPVYQRRRDLLVQACARSACTSSRPRAPSTSGCPCPTATLLRLHPAGARAGGRRGHAGTATGRRRGLRALLADTAGRPAGRGRPAHGRAGTTLGSRSAGRRMPDGR